jgi:hypothetical protein
MFEYPKKAEFNRVLPKSKIYAHAKPSRSVRDRFVSQVNEIVWKYKLSPETVNLPARQGIYEIQVFVLILKTAELAEDLLRTIDKAIPSPIFFQLTFDGRVKCAAAYKRPTDAGAARSVVDTYFEMPWQPVTVARPPLPVALDLASLYEQMLRRHIPVPSRPGEPLDAQVERVKQIRTKEIECIRLEARLSREVQFNRKVELNASLRLRRTELAQLQQM